MHRMLLALLVALAAYNSPVAAAETVLGRWCNTPLSAMPQLDSEITTQINTSGTAMVVHRFGNGSRIERELIKANASTYLVKDSAHGDGYRIIRSTGELRLIDKDGPISVASKLEKKPRVGDCLR